MPQQPRAVSLDIWGTLLGSDPDFKPERNALLRSTFAPHYDAVEFDQAMRRADRDADEICMSRGRDVGFAERVRLTLRRLGTAGDSDVDAELPNLLEQQAKLAQAHPPHALHADLPAVVQALSARMPVVLTSNTGMLPGTLMRRLLELAGFTGDLGQVFSCETGWAKPDRRIFEVSWEWIRARAREPLTRPDVVHVGDNPRADVDGAAGFGMRTALVTPDGASTLAVLRRIEGE
ncbi:HAD family hydrolase [Leekyejoonella antrihumi]|uniref:HAD family hydrolase n=1 Tax=Leekyejoonella antrihumi TaxID=1660198 RepID=A0A563E6L5_9MICO|nr:HAD family hydrolase [Leekyejoonella antrihumi]TWP38180.1 HAD family hydrolase [Leekyejoonella antrihumi]